MKIYIVIANWDNEDSHDYEIVATTTDKDTAIAAMKTDFDNQLEELGITDEEPQSYEIERGETSCSYYDNYAYDNYEVTIHERELN